jgi:hypothetical protein
MVLFKLCEAGEQIDVVSDFEVLAMDPCILLQLLRRFDVPVANKVLID